MFSNNDIHVLSSPFHLLARVIILYIFYIFLHSKDKVIFKMTLPEKVFQTY